MANTKAELKAAHDAWNAIRTTNASATDKRKAQMAYAHCAIRAEEEAIGEKVVPTGRRLHIVGTLK